MLPRTRPRAAPTRRATLRPAWALLVSLALSPAMVYGQSRNVEALYDEAFRLRDAQQFERALDLFTRAWEQTRAPRARAQMAITEQALGRWAIAFAHYREALAAADDPWIRSHAGPLTQAFAVVQRRVGHFEVRGGPPGAEVFVNGQRVAALPMHEPAPVEAGTSVVALRAPQHHGIQREVTITAGQTAIESMVLTPLELPAVAPRESSAPTPPPPPPDVARVSSARPGATLAWVFTGAAAFALVAGVVSQAYWASSRTDYNDRCPDRSTGLLAPPECAEGASYALERDSVMGPALVGMVVGYGLGAALGVTSIVLHAAARSGPRPDGRGSVFLRTSPGHFGVGYTLRF